MHGKIHEVDAVGALAVDVGFVVGIGVAGGLRAHLIDRAPSMLCREVRGDGVHYRAFYGQRQAACPGGVALSAGWMRTWVCGAGYFDAWRRCWSRQQIAYRWQTMFAQDRSMRLSHEARYSVLGVLPCGALR